MSPNITHLYFRFFVVALFSFCRFQSLGQDAGLLKNNKKVITTYIDVVINGHNLNRKGEFFQADYVWHTMDGKAVHYSQDSGHTTILRWLFNAIPDVYYTIDNIESGGDMVGVSTTAYSCHAHPLFLHVDPPLGGGNNLKSFLIFKSTNGY